MTIKAIGATVSMAYFITKDVEFVINGNNQYWQNATINNRKDNDEWRIAKDTVDNNFSIADEGKVVIDGKLVAQTVMPDEITENGTIDTTTYNSVTVNVSGGGVGMPKLATPTELANVVNNNKNVVFVYIRPNVSTISLEYYGQYFPSPQSPKKPYTIITNPTVTINFPFYTLYTAGATYSVIITTGTDTSLSFRYYRNETDTTSERISYNYAFQPNKTYLVVFNINRIQGNLSVNFSSATEYDEPITFTVE